MAGIDRVPSGRLGYGTGDGSGPLSRLLRDNALSPVFQPIVSMVDASIYAHEALIRGPQGTPLHMPDALLAAASAEGLLLDFEVACVVCVLERWAALAQPGRLFLNLSQSALLQMVNTRFSESLVDQAGQSEQRSGGSAPRPALEVEQERGGVKHRREHVGAT